MIIRSIAAATTAAAIAFAGLDGAEASVVSTNDFQLVQTVTTDRGKGANDCSGDLGIPPNCEWNGSRMIAKFDFEFGDVTKIIFTPGAFASVNGFTEFSFALDDEAKVYSWTYTPNDASDPGITAFSVKGGPGYAIYEKQGTAHPGVGDMADGWTAPLNRGGNISGLSHIVFFDSAADVVAPVPVPAAGVLLLGALGGLAAARRRRRAAD